MDKLFTIAVRLIANIFVVALISAIRSH